MNIYDEIEKITSKESLVGVETELKSFVDHALDENAITIYEAFQLMLMSDSYWLRIESRPVMNREPWVLNKKPWTDSLRVYLSMNLALMAKLFDEDELYQQLCRDAEKRLSIWCDMIRDKNGNVPLDNDYVLSDLSGLLSGDLEHMEKLSYVRKHKHRSRSHSKYHFHRFPYDFLKYEDELIKILKGEVDHYSIDKTISPEICDMMTAVELRALEFD